MEISEKKVFAKGYCFYKIFLIFIFGCLLGTYYEQILELVKTGVWESKAGVVIGPFNPIYGFGLAIIIAVLGKEKRPWHRTLIYGALLGGICEYILNFLEELVLNTASWDYSNHFLNINGRTTIPFMLFWGGASLLIIKFVYPTFSKLIELIPYKVGKIVTDILIIFMAINMILTGGALIRQAQRKEGIKADNPISEFFDYFFNDEYLSNVFTNMEIRGDK